MKCKGKRWEVILDERKCTCRVWQVKGLPCVHAVAFIAFLRDYNWEKYVDEYFTIKKLKEAYAMEIAPMLAMDEWVHTETQEKIYPPIMKRPAGRPRKERIKSHDEQKKRHKCPRCSKSGHHENRCKNPASQESDQYQASTSKRLALHRFSCFDKKFATFIQCDKVIYLSFFYYRGKSTKAR